MQLSYSEVIADIEAGVGWLAERGIGPWRPDRDPDAVGQLFAVPVDTDGARGRRGLRPGRRRRPDERAQLVFTEADVVGVITENGLTRGPGSSRGWRASAPHVIDDAWIIFTSGSTGTLKGWRSPSATPRACRCRGADVPAGQPHRAGRPGTRRAFGGIRRILRGDVAGLAQRRLPGAGAAVAGAQRHGPGAVAGLRDITVVSTVPTLAALWPAEALEAVRLLIFGGEACPRNWPNAWPWRAARCGTPTGRPRPPWSRAAPGSPEGRRSASACRFPAGTWWWSTPRVPR